jgi:hypothetical protein
VLEIKTAAKVLFFLDMEVISNVVFTEFSLKFNLQVSLVVKKTFRADILTWQS